MGLDMTMILYDKRTKEILEDNFINFRNAQWFENMQKNGNYHHFPAKSLNEAGVPFRVKEKLSDWEGNYFSLNSITVDDYRNWISSYKPYFDAGWCTKYQAWEYRVRNIIPILAHYRESLDAPDDDAVFLEVENKCDNNVEIIRKCNTFLKEHNSEDLVLYYWFNC